MRELRVAVYGEALCGWGGGLDFLRLLIQILLIKAQSKCIKVFLLLPEDYNPAFSIKKKLKKLFIRTPATGIQPELILESLLKNIDGGQFDVVFYTYNQLNQTLSKIKADVLLPVGPSSSIPKFCVPHIGFIFDFQHKYLPQFFTAQECLARDKSFEAIVQSSQAVIVHAKEVAHDIEKFFPAKQAKVFSLPFAASPIKDWLHVREYQAIKAKYTLPEKYFMIANQFWIHKNHLTAFKALAQLNRSDIHIVCTGNTHDYRAPGYFDDLKKNLEQMGLGARVHFLNFIPKQDQIMIMKHAYCLIQPTLFEGLPGGGSVWDAISIGTPVLVSDISVNRELPSEFVQFFITESADDLASKMCDILAKKRVDKTPEVLLAQGHKRLEQCGDVLIKALEHVTQQKELS